MGGLTGCRKQKGTSRGVSTHHLLCLSGWQSFPTPWCSPQLCSQMWWIRPLESHWAFGALIIPDSLQLLAFPHILSSFYHKERRMAVKYTQSWENTKHKVEVIFDTFGKTPWCNLGYPWWLQAGYLIFTDILEHKELWGDLIVAFQYVKKAYKTDEQTFCQVL